jgi:hypothetical protein
MQNRVAHLLRGTIGTKGGDRKSEAVKDQSANGTLIRGTNSRAYILAGVMIRSGAPAVWP